MRTGLVALHKKHAGADSRAETFNSVPTLAKNIACCPLVALYAF
ncbi:hypothetical protein SAMN04515617_103153 [Collimonas sp. OK242]|nr:hypothetical protein SAMN04515617_103153 [Collimonas sp. OK242]